MQQQSQSQQNLSQANVNIVAELVEGVGRSVALTIEVFLHRGFGCRYVNCGLMGVVIIFLFGMWFPDEDLRPLLGYAAVYGVLWLCAGISVLLRRWRGKDTIHSRYTGRPWLWRLVPKWKEENVKHLEAMMMILLGFGVHFLNRPLGDYLMLASSLVLLRGYNLAIQRRDRAVALNDSVIEQELVAQRFREMRGE